MQVYNLPAEIQNKIFYFLEHPTAAIIRGHTFYHFYDFYHEEETQRFFAERDHMEMQIKHKLKTTYITENKIKKLDPLFVHMNKDIIEAIIICHMELDNDSEND